MGGVDVEDIYGPQLEQEEQPTSVYDYQNTPENRSWAGALPVKQGLYDPEYEKDACGVGFAAHIKGKPSHKIIVRRPQAQEALLTLEYTAEPTTTERCTEPTMQHDPSRGRRLRRPRRRWRRCNDIHPTQILHQEFCPRNWLRSSSSRSICGRQPLLQA